MIGKNVFEEYQYTRKRVNETHTIKLLYTTSLHYFPSHCHLKCDIVFANCFLIGLFITSRYFAWKVYRPKTNNTQCVHDKGNTDYKQTNYRQTARTKQSK